MSDLSKDVPVLNLEQFSALHMAISVQGIEYSLSSESNLKERLADGWLVIAKLGKGGGVYKEPCYIFLSKPVEEEEEE